MKFALDTTLPEKLDVTSPDAAVGVPFAEAVFAATGVASIFGVNDFVTVRRQPGFEWDPWGNRPLASNCDKDGWVLIERVPSSGRPTDAVKDCVREGTELPGRWHPVDED